MARRYLFQHDDSTDTHFEVPTTGPVPITPWVSAPFNDAVPGAYLYFPVEGKSIEDLYDWSKEVPGSTNIITPPGRSPCKREPTALGTLVHVNGVEVALFRYGNDVVATDSRCPHLGGPLHLGDIETLPDRSLCVRCPVHGWKFDVVTGTCKIPGKEKQLGLKTYPVIYDPVLKCIKVGFPNINPKFFKEPCC